MEPAQHNKTWWNSVGFLSFISIPVTLISNTMFAIPLYEIYCAFTQSIQDGCDPAGLSRGGVKKRAYVSSMELILSR